MRILIFSDLHANATALAALQCVEPEPDAIFFIGDAVGYGPDMAECVAWVAQNVTVAVQGDHDCAMATGVECASPLEWRDLAHATRDTSQKMISPRQRNFLGALPVSREIEMGGARFCLTHQLPSASLAMPEEKFAWLENSNADVVLGGHTHIPFMRRVKSKWVVNPGSLGQPRHGSPSPTYAVWQDGDLSIRHIDYNPRAVMQRLALLPLAPEYIERLQSTLANGI